MSIGSKIVFCFVSIILLSSFIFSQTVFAQTEENAEILFNQATEHFKNGEYKEALSIYDEVLEIAPDNISTLKMKGIAQSNLSDHSKSLNQFYKILQLSPNDAIALTGMGIGFGNLGEYKEAVKYFDKAIKEKPNSTVIKNYKEFIDKVISKYPYDPTEKPDGLEKTYITSIPKWVKSITGWWASGIVEDNEFVSIIQYLLENEIIQIPPTQNSEDTSSIEIKENFELWAKNNADDNYFVVGVHQMIANEMFSYEFQEPSKSQEELGHESYLFDRYIKKILNDISKEKRYIESSNPSKDVIKKFLRDYIKWNFENEVKKASESFPNPTFEIIDDTYIVNYKVYINEQPTGLPLDHVSTLKNSFSFWEGQELTSNDQKTKMKFEVTNQKYEANVWVTWVVRDIGEGVLGHAHLGKGVVEVTLGDYNCDGIFQLYDVNSVETIMTHELGHSIGLKHVSEKESIMYPSLSPSYAYCLLS
ncbi:MAG: tetratricopeptide repeat protein [Thaumarchaeota archaeon]|jgi:tetratricopeptide (TPR) repeat protein|nr:tetratricopeptide repeat protein [Nitrososphaerota archaeon]